MTFIRHSHVYRRPRRRSFAAILFLPALFCRSVLERDAKDTRGANPITPSRYCELCETHSLDLKVTLRKISARRFRYTSGERAGNSTGINACGSTSSLWLRSAMYLRHMDSFATCFCIMACMTYLT